MKIAIVGAAYTGKALARRLKAQGHTVSVTTTRAERADELKPIADRVVVTKGSDVEGMKRRTRNYAKRQLTWMRRLEGANLLDAAAEPASRLLDLVKEEEK